MCCPKEFGTPDGQRRIPHFALYKHTEVIESHPTKLMCATRNGLDSPRSLQFIKQNP